MKGRTNLVWMVVVSLAAAGAAACEGITAGPGADGSDVPVISHDASGAEADAPAPKPDAPAPEADAPAPEADAPAVEPDAPVVEPECEPGEKRPHVCPDGEAVPHCTCAADGTWECVEAPEKQCREPECTPGEERPYVCGDGTEVSHCTCAADGTWQCREDPDATCPPSACGAEGISIPDRPEDPPCCDGLRPVGCDSPNEAGECMECDGVVVCTRCGNGECGPGENVCNCPEDCKLPASDCEARGGYCEHFEVECRDGFEGDAPLGCPQGRSAQCCLPVTEQCEEAADCLRREWAVDCWGSWACEEGTCVEQCPGTCGDSECVAEHGEDRATCFPDCGAQCRTGDERPHACPDGSLVDWCTCQIGLWLCVDDPGSACRDTSCDDGSDAICLAEPPECHPWEILAVKNGCWECVYPETCDPWGLPVCERDAQCAVTERCDDCAQPACPHCSACMPGCVPHNCATEEMALCKMLRPDCAEGQVAIVENHCWVCVDERTCEPPEPDCVGEGEAIPVIPDAPECCAGLRRVGCERLSSDGECMPTPPGCGGICTRCGNGDCGPGEDRCNCPEDCEEPTPECQPDEEVPHVCPDGRMVPWCTCEGGQWVCIISPENACRDTSCDDGTQPMCMMPVPLCREHEILAYQANCFRCVNPATCLPWGQDACESDRDCPVEERCDGCGSSSCPDCRDCVAACMPHGCATEPIALCNMPRTECGEGEVSIVHDACWQCVSLDTCEEPPRPECEDRGGYCAHFLESCDEGYVSGPSLGCPMGRSGQCCLPEEQVCLAEGERGAVVPSTPECCEGLTPVGCEAPSSDGECWPCDGAFVCTRCGDGECGVGENLCNCPGDCEPAPTCQVPSDCADLFWDIRCYGHWSCREGQCEEVCDYVGCGDGICAREKGETETSCRPDCGQECVDGELREHRCPDGSFVPWCTCLAGRWSCIKSPENACRDTSCDDGKPLTCRMAVPNCKDFEILAHQDGCYVCVNPVSCKPWGEPGCSRDADCEPKDFCDDCATSSDPDADDCVAACMPHGCPTEQDLACYCARPDCEEGGVAVLINGCWQCVGFDACQPTGEGCAPGAGP